jgi:Gpi16 subunit, GPI transamidase component
MSIDVRPICLNDENDCILEIEQSVDMVLDIDRSKRPRGMLIICIQLEYLWTKS